MFSLSIESVKPGMIIYEDIYSPSNEILFKANTELTEEKIQILIDNNFSEISLSEPDEIDMPRYKHLHLNEHFNHFREVYEESIPSFIKIMRTLDTGLDLNLLKLLDIRDKIMACVKNGEQLLDYLYNMMPNETEITYIHCLNCGLLSYVFGQWLNYNVEDLDILTISGYLFDIGKTKISDDILWKPGKLTDDEFNKMQKHINLGYELLKGRNLPPHVVSVMIMHHERCDGSGYPAKLKENRIDPFAILAGIVDTYSALTHPRAQRTALTPFQAIRAFEEQGLEKFGPNVKTILSRIANSYVDRRICITGNLHGRIVSINEDDLSRPVIFAFNTTHDLRSTPYTEIIRML